MKKRRWILNWHFVSRVVGFILCFNAVFLSLSAAVAYYLQEDVVLHFLYAAAAALACGALLIALGPKHKTKILGKRESFLTVTLSWVAFSLFGALPFFTSAYIPSFTDAFFETMSGLSTTGSSILVDVEQLPHSLLFWRSLLQWIGGMGIIFFTLALLPLLGGGAIQLYDAETTGITHDKFQPRIGQIAVRIWGIYIFLTLLLAGLLYIGPMNLFDSICHALSIMATGGFSTKHNSLAYWNSAYIDYLSSAFMIIASCNFVLLYFFIKGRFKTVFKNEELRWYFSIIAFVSVLLAFYLLANHHTNGFAQSFRLSFFQVSSVISTTGLATADYTFWGSFSWIVLLLVMVICGCAGSTSGGMKVIRLVVLAKNATNEFKKQLHPRAILPVRINGMVLSNDVVHRTMSFVFLYLTIIVISWLFLSVNGLGFLEAIGASITALSNVGPGFGQQGPMGNFADLNTLSKWYMALLMLIGRLELFTVLTLFTPGFWRKM